MPEKTPFRAKPIEENGRLYQRRAVRVLPLLVRQARAGETIPYGELARELEMPNARNMNFVLGSVGASLRELSKAWSVRIPPLQAVAVNKFSRLPGSGFADFPDFPMDPKTFRRAPILERRRIVSRLLHEVYNFRQWDRVLRHFGVRAAQHPDLSQVLGLRVRHALGAGGESEIHKAFKQYVADHPEAVGVRRLVGRPQIEYLLPSSDALDVLFTTKAELVGVEVKTRNAGEPDLLRGIFQCVKYKALLEAMAALELHGKVPRILLATEAPFPFSLRGIANTLGVQVQDSVGKR